MFKAVVTSDDSSMQKPSARPLLLGLGLIAVLPGTSAMYGDTNIDIIAGKRARCWRTIATTHGFGKIAVHSSNPDYVINSNNELIPILEQLQGSS